MRGYRHILLVLDFSPSDNLVANKAEALALTFAAQISIIHVLDDIPMPSVPYGEVLSLEDEVDDVLLAIKKTKLKHWGERFAIPNKNLWLVWGIPQQEIAQIALRERVDLIIVGFHEKHGLTSLFSSTAEALLQVSHCDVLLVKAA